MSILHIFTGREKDRASLHAAELIIGLQDAGIAQGVVMDNRSSCYAALGKAGIAMMPMPRLQWRNSLSLRWHMANFKPGLVVCWTRAAADLVSFDTTPLVVWLGGHDDPHRFPPSAHFVAATVNVAAHLVRNEVPRSCIRFIPLFAGLSSAGPADRNLLATPRDAKVLLNFSRLHPGNHLDLLLAVLKDLPNCYLWLAGEGPLRRELEKSAIDSGLIERIRFAGKSIDRAALLRAADFCVLPGTEDPSNPIIPEAWMAGIPIVAVQKPGFADLLEDKMNSRAVPIDNVSAFSGAIRSLIDDGDLRRRLVSQGYSDALRFYSRQTVIRQWIDLYQNLSLQTAPAETNASQALWAGASGR